MWNLASMHAYGERIVLIYQRGIQKSQFEDGQTIQWSSEKWQIEKQWSTKHNKGN
jgi:hypothetical protein